MIPETFVWSPEWSKLRRDVLRDLAEKCKREVDEIILGPQSDD